MLHANSAAKNILSLDVFTHIRQLERVNRKLCHTLTKIRPFEQKLVTIHSEKGSTQLLLKTTPFTIKQQELILLSIQDIKNELDEKELDSWIRLIRVLMHEIMNSIAPITSVSETLSGLFVKNGQRITTGEITPQLIDATIRGLEVIREQGKGMMEFVESYRKLTRLPKPDKKMICVRELFSRLNMLMPATGEDASVDLHAAVNPPGLKIFADEIQITQVLVNLVKNALEANTGNPNVNIRLAAYLNDQGKPCISVSDNGPGIPDELQENIFVPFFTTREHGSGIGLSVSRQIMRLHGGNLTMHSKPSVETTFYLCFPENPDGNRQL